MVTRSVHAKVYKKPEKKTFFRKKKCICLPLALCHHGLIPYPTKKPQCPFVDIAGNMLSFPDVR